MDNSRRTVLPYQLDLATFHHNLATSRLGKAPGWANELWESIDSTNNRACELALQGAPDGVIVLARQQTQGRGRLGRSWISPPDSGLYMSCLLKPLSGRTDLGLHTLACGVACVKAINDTTGVSVGLKWVNDLIVAGKKAGGILAEIPSFQCAADDHIALVLGIGINLRLAPSSVPPELQTKIDSLEHYSAEPINPNLLAASIALNLEEVIDLLDKGKQAQVLDAWRQHCLTLGRRIRAKSGLTEVEGIAVDIDGSGALIVEQDSGQRIALHAGEISIVNADGTYS